MRNSKVQDKDKLLFLDPYLTVVESMPLSDGKVRS
jgi:hypothetical protein